MKQETLNKQVLTSFASTSKDYQGGRTHPSFNRKRCLTFSDKFSYLFLLRNDLQLKMALNKKEIDMFAYPELFREVKRQTMRQLALGDETSLILCSELCRALSCKASHPDPMSLSLPPLLDHAWHVPILNTKEYARFCQENFGQFLDHTTVTDEDSGEEKQERIDALRKLYQTTYGREPNPSLWQFHREDDNVANPDPRGISQRIELTGLVTLYVKTILGQSLVLHVPHNATVLELNRRIEMLDGPRSDQQRIIFNGKQLEEGGTIDAYAICHESTIYVGEDVDI